MQIHEASFVGGGPCQRLHDLARILETVGFQVLAETNDGFFDGHVPMPERDTTAIGLRSRSYGDG